jgi:hypothetical protein
VAQITSPTVAVVLEQDDQDVEIIVQTDNRDAIQWDVSRARKDWPKQQDAPTLWLTFMAWHALKRTGETKFTLDEFLGACLGVRPVKRDGSPLSLAEAKAGLEGRVDPTRPGPGTD